MVPPQNLIIGGHSQGCAMSLAVLLSLDYSIGEHRQGLGTGKRSLGYPLTLWTALRKSRQRTGLQSFLATGRQARWYHVRWESVQHNLCKIPDDIDDFCNFIAFKVGWELANATACA
ncbi:acyl thioesterase [Fusarium napiforme]|uniref:Acyl thioesterase n=1 Tax=Fusarium napiforme TaxID=42672 RepID=A0A8H5NID1_9HYPO|nr:acyl thioesterase [Fusarium napiforme]